MAHSHSHSHGPAPDHSRAFSLSVFLNLVIVFVELGAGWWIGSLALIADAAHNFGDVLGLIMAWAATRLAKVKSTPRFTYGLRRSSVLAALGNAVLLLVGTGGLAWEAIERLRMGPKAPEQPGIIIGVALLGVVINSATALMFAGHGGDVNLRGAYLHLLSDAMVAMAVVISGLILYYTGWAYIDPLATLLVAAAILWSTWSLFKESVALSLDAVPGQIAAADVEEYLGTLPGVKSLHDFHIWPLSTDQTALSVHLVRPQGLDDAFLEQVSRELRERFSIHHVTVQLEEGTLDCHCRPHD